ncbi:MAG: ParA family protein [Methylocella sp.]
MRTIAFVSQKGGCGKSALAACLAVAAKEAGELVFVLDMDPRKSVVRWGSKRNDPLLPVAVVSAATLPAALAYLSKGNMSLVIVDTPHLESPRTLAAINTADLSIVPARPATLDILAAEVTGHKLKLMGKEFVFLLNQCPPTRQASHVREGIATLEAVGALLRPRIRASADFLEAARTGTGVTEVDPKGEAAQAMRDLWLALKRRLRAIQTRGCAEPHTR